MHSSDAKGVLLSSYKPPTSSYNTLFFLPSLHHSHVSFFYLFFCYHAASKFSSAIASNISICHGRAQNVREVETPTPTTGRPPPRRISSARKQNFLLKTIVDSNSTMATWKSSWMHTGAHTFPNKFLDENSIEKWVDNLFQTIIVVESQGGSTNNSIAPTLQYDAFTGD